MAVLSRGRKSEARGQKTEDRGQRTVNRGRSRSRETSGWPHSNRRNLMSAAEQVPGDGSVIPFSDEKGTLDILTKAVFGLWDTVNNLTRLRPTKRERYRVSIFGSARVDPNHWVYAAVRDVAAELTRLGCDVVTGGGPGLMQAANEGAKLADPEGHARKSVGIRVELPFEQDVNSFVTDAFEHKTFFTRL